MSEPTDTRVCVLSMRGWRPEVARCSVYEFEDCILSLGHADLVAPRRLLRDFPERLRGPLTALGR